MKLSVFDRILLLNILPKEGNFRTLRILRELKEQLSFSEDEHHSLELKEENGIVHWKTEADTSKEVSIGPVAREVIAATLQELDKKNKLHEDHISLYERFVDVEEPTESKVLQEVN